MIESRHTLSNCEMCGDMVVCADCGNNCCNGGTKDVNGKPCGCDEAYAHQTQWCKDPASVHFAADVRPLGGSASTLRSSLPA